MFMRALRTHLFRTSGIMGTFYPRDVLIGNQSAAINKAGYRGALPPISRNTHR